MGKREFVEKDLPTGKILKGDVLEKLSEIPSGSIDMIFADPPYNLQLGGNLLRPNNQSLVDGVTDSWDQFSSLSAYDQFTKNWLTQCRRILKPDGTIWVIGSYHNIFRIGTILQDKGYWFLNDVIWRKTNPMPNFKGRRFTNAHETLIWAAKSKNARYTFNYDSMKAFNDDIQMRSDWLLPICSGAERLKNKEGKKAHPTQKPESLLYRVLLAASNKGDIVLDPFFGSGTTGAVAKALGRQWIGIERDETYIDIAQKRIETVKVLDELVLGHIKPKRARPRIPFGTLLELGLIKAGAHLYNKKQTIKAIVRADGSLKTDKGEGSIHKMGAAVQGLEACNGWTYWYVEKNSQLLMLDKLRDEARIALGLTNTA